MSGAVSFHLFTPLGIDPNNDGAGLFGMAVVVWLTSLAMVIANRSVLIELVTAIGGVLVPSDMPPRPTAEGPVLTPVRS
jgi:hypothetical protein